jgi:hypothetical protein
MAKAKNKNGTNTAPITTSQMLGGVLKVARDIMRKDKRRPRSFTAAHLDHVPKVS